MVARLKYLELHGYKTFASRTDFQFPGDITAIVGPNGSGKSNIADSIRWVLGEQSYGLLRGRKTEDMIFAGSEQRPRAGMASASITFNNEDGWLPIDYSEVSIARRAYRDGQNEYLLNGQRVRLKEISELLAQSGLAERTYTIIGQGLVDAALSLRPDERRRFFEEAAGIGLYRSRREESLNRLDATRRNLERVLDILAELEPRLLSLEKQARRVQDYERVKADLKLLLRDWYGYYWHRTQQDLLHAHEAARVQDGTLLTSREKLKIIESQMTELRSRLQSLRVQLNEWHAQSAHLHVRSEKISRDLAVMDERQRALLEQHQSLQSDLARLEEEYQAGEQKLTLLVEDRTHLEQELKDGQTQSQNAQKGLVERQDERGVIERDLRESRRQLLSHETRQLQLHARLEELQNRLDSQGKSLESIKQSMERDVQALTSLQLRLDQASETRKLGEADQQAIQEQIQQQKKNLNELEAARRQLLEERTHLEGEKTRLITQMDVLEQAEKSFSGLNQGARFLLQEAKAGRIVSKIQALSSLLIVPAEYEAAIASVLGDFLDAVWLKDSSSLEPALLLLGQGEKGRAVLLPSELDGAVHVAKPIQDEDCLGIAAELVSAPQAMQKMVNTLLGQVWVVKDRKAARRLLKHIEPGNRLVTLQGEVFWGSGIVVAGRDGRTGMISRPRQKQELQESLVGVEQKLAELNQKLAGMEGELAQRRTSEVESEKQAQQANQNLNQANQAYQQTRLEFEQSRQRQEWQQSQLKTIQTQLQKTEEDMTTGQAELEKVKERIHTFNGEVRHFNRDLIDLPMEELQAEVNHWSTNAAVTARALKDANRRLEEHQLAEDSSFQQQEILKERLNTIESALTSLEREKTALREEEGTLAQEIERFQGLSEPAEQDLDGLEIAYSKIQEDQAVATQFVTIAERHSTQSQMEMNRIREALDSMRHRIEDDFGLVTFEAGSEMAQTPLPLGDMVSELPVVTELPVELEDAINRLRSQIRRMGAINPEAQIEYIEVHERYVFLKTQVEDLKKADEDLREVIFELDELMRREFRKTFDAVAIEFKGMFTRLFNGGSARLVLTDEENVTETGIDIETRLPGRREQGLSLLSGGERSLTAVALIFSLLKVSPTPFCVLDEVDAMLDEANVGRFRDLLMELSVNTQFIIITHNRNTVQAAGVIYGITMGRDSTSQVISLRLDDISEEMVR